MWTSLLLVACATAPVAEPEPPEPTPRVVVPFEPPPITAYRLTERQLRNTWLDLTGVDWQGTLPADLALHGYTNVGASELTVPPVDLEVYEAAAWGVATTWLPDDQAATVVGCDDLLTAEADRAASCIRGWAVAVATQGWRRAVLAEEIDDLMWLYDEVEPLGGRATAARALAAAMLQAPDLLFRVEQGTPAPQLGWRRLTPRERAERLAYVFTDAPADDALLAADLTQDDVAVAEVDRLVTSDRGRATLLRWWSETLELEKLELIEKDPSLGNFSPSIREAMAVELEWLFEHVALDEQDDLATLLTSRAARLSPELAALYGRPAPGDIELPENVHRGGVLGRAGVLALHAHTASTSPTLRGRFVRARMLCQSIPPPPAGVLASLDEVPDGPTLRERLEQHMDDDACRSCHLAMDPIGFAMEPFDPIGRRRLSDNGHPIDATGTLDGVDFDGTDQLGEVVAEHPAFYGCMTLQIVRHALGQAEQQPQLVAVDRLTTVLEDGGTLQPLLEALTLDDVFLTASAPLGESCTTDGETRPCSTSCGEGTETCTDGRWARCDAPAAPPEACDGVDQDCDGQADPAFLAPCVSSVGPGVISCVDGGWSDCAPPPPPQEVCNGVDDDLDGAIDEELEIAHMSLTTDDLLAAHPDCHPTTDPWSGACHAAFHRSCAATSCATTGFGPTATSTVGLDAVCIADAEVVGTSFTELATHHEGCTDVSQRGGSCGAAINRFCASRGQVTGYGPVEHSGDYAAVVCTPGAANLGITYTELSVFEPTCNGAYPRWGSVCSSAIDQWCLNEGYAAGFGPLENYGDDVSVACLEAP